MTNSIDKKMIEAAWQRAYDKRPLVDTCSREIQIDIVGTRCIYINDHRVCGNKPYASENLPTESRRTTVRQVLEAFTFKEIQDYLEEKKLLEAYFKGLRQFRDELIAATDGQQTERGAE